MMTEAEEDIVKNLAQSSVDVIRAATKDQAQALVFVFRDGALCYAHNIEDGKVPFFLRHFADLIDKEPPPGGAK